MSHSSTTPPSGGEPNIIRNALPKLSRMQQIVGLLIAVVSLLLLGIRKISTFYTDYLWFSSVGFSSVFTGLFGTKVLLAALAVLIIGFLVWLNLWVADRFAPRVIHAHLAESPVAQAYQTWRELKAKWRTLVRLLIAIAVAASVGLGFYSHWHDWLLFTSGGNFGQKDPLFQKDIGFFVFQLPFLSTAVNWLFGVVLLCILLTVGAHFFNGGIAFRANRLQTTKAARAHIAIVLALFAVVRAVQYYLERFQLNYSMRSQQVEVGANYTDVKFVLPALGFLIMVSLVAAVLFLISARSNRWGLPITTVVAWGVISLLLGTLLPAGVQRLLVKPDEKNKELTYLQRNIDATRTALGLNNINTRSFDYQSNLTGDDIKANAQTIRNIRLWDPEITKPSYQRLQESRSFFHFSDIDVDRYEIDGKPTQMMLSVRELNAAQLPNTKRSWVNERLQYTHGYGAVVSPANAVTSDGKPDFSLKDVPPIGSPKLTRPEVYFGEKASRDHYVIVSSGQPEIDYVKADGQDQTSSYAGKGGVELRGIVRRAALAARVGEIEPLISGAIGKKSRAMYMTNIVQRAKEAAPFLKFDADPYPVIIDGRIQWIQDAYTTTSAYPYATDADTRHLDAKSELRGERFNYIRNSVKVVTDAYDGTMTFYVVDQKDPLIKAWQKTFPKLFTDGSKMPSELRSHLRYPEDLFRLQSQMFGQYHMTNADAFYSRTDRWNIAQSPPRAPQGTTTTTVVVNGQTVSRNEDRIDPYYLLMRLPQDERESFLLFQPMVPYSPNDQRKELSAFLTAKSDPGNYGQLEAFVMPRDQMVDGPALIDARINAEPTIAREVSLLNQQGSRVSYGDMLIVPIKNGIVYVRTMYVLAQNTQVPEFKAAIVLSGNKIAMEPTLAKALEAVFGSAPETLEQGNLGGASTGGATTVPPASGGSTPGTTVPGGPGGQSTGGTGAAPGGQVGQAEALTQAKQEFDAADQALRNGDLAEYQRRVRAGIALVDKARNG